MVIGIDASRANVPEKTGTEWYAFHVIQELKHLIPSDVEVVLYSKEALTGELAELPDNWRSRVLKWPFPLLWTQARLSAHMMVHKPNVLYVPTHTLPLFPPHNSLTVIHDVGFAHQDTLYDSSTIGGGSSIKKKVLNALVRLLTGGKYSAREQDYHRFAVHHAKKHAEKIITVSAFSQSELMKYYDVPQDQLQVIPNGFNARERSSKKPIVDGPYILYVGRIERKKNSATLIDAFEKMQRGGYAGKLVLAGKPGFGYDEVEKRIAHHGLERTVVQTGYVSENDLSALLQNADLFVFPSSYEGFGIPVLEAMAAGTPVACSDIPALKEVAADAAAFFDPSSADDIAKVVSDVLTNPANQEELLKRGINRAAQFSWEKTAKMTWEELEGLLKSTEAE